MTSSYTTVGKELQKVKVEPDSPSKGLPGSPVTADTSSPIQSLSDSPVKSETNSPTTADSKPEKKSHPKRRVSPADQKLLSQNLAGPQIILANIDNAVVILKDYVAKAKERVTHLEVSIKATKPTDDSIIKEYKHNISTFFSMSDDSIRLTNEKIRIVSKAIGDILEMKSELGNCDRFTVEAINDPEHPISSLLYYLFILISEHSEILKQAFIQMNKHHLGESLGTAINTLLETPLKIAAEYSHSGELEKNLSTLTKSLTLTYPEQANAAKKALENLMQEQAAEIQKQAAADKKALEKLMLNDAIYIVIPSHIARLDDYIKETSSRLNKADVDNPVDLTGKKLKLAIDLRAQLKFLMKDAFNQGFKDQSAQQLQQIVACILSFEEKHNAITGEAIQTKINNYLGNTIGSWINYLFGRIITPLSQVSHSKRLGNEFATTKLTLNTQLPGILEAAAHPAAAQPAATQPVAIKVR